VSYTETVVGFIVMAILIAAILALGTLHMAGVLPQDGHRHEDSAATGQDAEGDRHDGDAHQHWWHRAA
jgi:hypothetical protein